MDINQILGYVGALMVGLVLGLIGGGGSILTVPILVRVTDGVEDPPLQVPGAVSTVPAAYAPQPEPVNKSPTV